jgi:bacteriocin-like protein
MQTLHDEELNAISGGDVDGLGPYTPGPDFDTTCPNLERFLEWRRLNPFYGL